MEKDELIRLYACCRQAQMSLHRVLPFGDVWPELHEFYRERKQSFQVIVENLHTLAPADSAARAHLERKQIEKRARWLTLLHPLRSLANRRRTNIRVAPRYLTFIRASLERFSGMLEQPTRPETSEIIEMRRELHTSQWILSVYLAGVKEVAQADLIEHFNQSDFRRHVSLEDLNAPVSRFVKRSA